MLKDSGFLRPEYTLCVVDRGVGGKEALSESGLELRSLLQL